MLRGDGILLLDGLKNNKYRFNEQFFIKQPLPKKHSKVNLDMVQNFILSFYKEDNRIKDDRYWYLNQYHNINFHQHIGWLSEFTRDHWLGEFGSTPVLTNKFPIKALIQQKGESIHTHNHIDEYNLPDSPDISVLFTVSHSNLKDPVYVVFEYENVRHKHCRWKIPLETGNFIIFSSNLNHHFTKNTNDDLLINLQFNYQLI